MSQEARPHWSHCAVQHAQQGHCLAGPRLDKLEMTLRRRVEDEEFPGAIRLQSAQVGSISPHLAGQIMNKRPGRSTAIGISSQPKPLSE